MTMNEKLTAAIDLYDEAIHKLPEYDTERVAAARNLVDTMNEAKKAEATLIEKMHVDLIVAADNVNRCADCVLPRVKLEEWASFSTIVIVHPRPSL